MGFLDRFRIKETRADAGHQNDPLQGIITAYSLKKAKPYEPSIEQDWWEGHYSTMPFAMQEWGKDIHVYLGDVAEVTELYLGRVLPGSKLPLDGSPQRLDRIVGPEGAELAAQFVLLAHPVGDFDYPELRLPEFLFGLPRLSLSVAEIAIYDNFRGLFFILKQPITRYDFENDLRIASEMVKALNSWASKTLPK